MALIAASGVAHKEHNVLVLQPDAKKILSGEPANETPSAGRIGSRWPDQHRAATWSRADHNLDRLLTA